MSEMNEHAERLMDFAEHDADPTQRALIRAAAAEIERLAARVRELERSSKYLIQEGDRISFTVDPHTAGPVTINGMKAHPVEHNCGLPWTLPKLRGIGDHPCPACEATAPPPSPAQSP